MQPWMLQHFTFRALNVCSGRALAAFRKTASNDMGDFMASVSKLLWVITVCCSLAALATQPCLRLRCRPAQSCLSFVTCLWAPQAIPRVQRALDGMRQEADATARNVAERKVALGQALAEATMCRSRPTPEERMACVGESRRAME